MMIASAAIKNTAGNSFMRNRDWTWCIRILSMFFFAWQRGKIYKLLHFSSSLHFLIFTAPLKPNIVLLKNNYEPYRQFLVTQNSIIPQLCAQMKYYASGFTTVQLGQGLTNLIPYNKDVKNWPSDLLGLKSNFWLMRARTCW